MNDSARSGILGGIVGAVLACLASVLAARAGWISLSDGSAIRGYLLDHPEVLIEAQTKLQEKQEASDDAARQAAVDKIGTKVFFNPRMAFITGPATAKTTIVEFFDYNCPYCRESVPAVKKFYDSHKNVRFAFIEFPIKGAQSTLAARAAVASRKQPDKYLAFHFALMNEEHIVDENLVYADARKAGLDVDQLKADMKSPEVDYALAASHNLAQTVGIDGTPAFIINGRIREGAVDDAILKQMANS